MASFPDRTEPLLVGRPEPSPDDEGSDASSMGTNLYHLALKYWSEGRPEDAMRVGREALEILRKDPKATSLVAALDAMLEEIGPEIAPEHEPPTPA
jgi:hypothetical protein